MVQGGMVLISTAQGTSDPCVVVMDMPVVVVGVGIHTSWLTVGWASRRGHRRACSTC